MNMLSQLNAFVTKNVQLFMNNYMLNIINGFNNPYSIYNYEQFTVDFDKFTTNLNKDMYEAFIINLDEAFMHTSIRKQTYDSRGYVTKPLLTKFGWISFKRRRYENKITGQSFMFVDRFLGLTKYSRMDPFIVSDLCEEASSTSYSKAAKNLSKQIGNKIKYEEDFSKCIISRATARNNVIKASIIIKEPTSDTYKEVEEINIMLDEKFVGSQFNDCKDHMVKAGVIFEGTKLEYKNRIRLTGKRVFGSIEDDLLKEMMDFIYYNYDTDKLKRINFMGDGASWIKTFALNSSFKYHKDIIIKFGLDHFHMAEAIQLITTNKYKDSFSKILKNYIINDKKDDFITVCNALINLQPTREEKINEKLNYILSNWNYIQASFHDIKYKCSMESNISHVFADIFTSRPKAYSKNGLKSLLKIRMLKTNGYDFKKLYFEALDNKEKELKEAILINKICLNNHSLENKYVDYFNHKLPLKNFH